MHGAQDRQIDFAATNHGEAVVAAKNRRAFDGGHGLLARIDQVGIDFIFCGKRANAQHAVFRLQPHFNVGRHMVGHQGGNANAQIDIEAVLQFVCGTSRHLVLTPAHA